MSLLQEKAPDCIKRAGIEVFSGRTIACDASMVILINKVLCRKQYYIKLYNELEKTIYI